MKRLLTTAILVSLVLALLGSTCLGAPKTKIVFSAGSAQQNTLKRLASEFSAKSPDIQVELLIQPAASVDHYNRLIPVLAAKDDSTDVFYMDVIWPGTFITNGWLAPLDKWFTPDIQSQFLKGAVQTFSSKGHVYGVPLFTDGGLFYYRKDLLDKYGLSVPETWGEMIRQAQFILEKEKNAALDGYLYQGFRGEGAVCNWLEVLWSMGGDMVDESGRVVMNQSNRGQAALQFMVDLVTKHKVSPRSVATDRPDDSRLKFLNGRAVFMRNWTFAYASLIEDSSPIKGKVGVAAIPHDPGYESASCLGGWGVGVSAFSKHKEAAWKFVDFLTSYESQKALALGEATLPTRSAVYDDRDILAQMPWFASFGRGLSVVRPRPVHPDYLEMSSMLQPELNAAISGNKSSQDAIAAMTTTLTSILGK